MAAGLRYTAALLAVLAIALWARADGRQRAQAPLAVLQGPAWAPPGSTVRFSGRASFRPGGRIVAYRFELGETVFEGSRPEASFSGLRPGEHTVRLTVTAEDGQQASVRQPLFVEPLERHLRRKLEARARRGVVLFMCERGPLDTARAIEDLGEAILGPLLRAAYAEVVVVRGTEATPEDFFAAIRSLAARREAVDLILLAHGSPDRLWLREGRPIRGADIVEQLEGRGGERLRMVYSSLCYGASLNQAWRKAGARAVAGAVDVKIPLDLPAFLLGWLAGGEYASVMAQAYAANLRLHALREQLADRLRPGYASLRPVLEEAGPGRAARFYLDAFFEPEAWQGWKSYPVIEGGGVTIDTFPAPPGDS
ncbi:MAG: hypothetical protein KatS3mg102_2825 [Planctomycetota bacterium]|nr:MAG: hypothetical protein KatS3mg102_2825 [Planctomycetota bacterium]